MVRIHFSKGIGKRVNIRAKPSRPRKMKVRPARKAPKRKQRKPIPAIIRSRREKRRIRQNTAKEIDEDYDFYTGGEDYKKTYQIPLPDQQIGGMEPEETADDTDNKPNLKELIENNVEGIFELNFPSATYNYSIGGSLDYFIEKVRNDLSYLYQKYSEPVSEEPVSEEPVNVKNLTNPLNKTLRNYGYHQLAPKPRFRIRRRQVMRNPPTDDEPEPTDDEPEPTPTEFQITCPEYTNFESDKNVLFNKVDSLLEPSLRGDSTLEELKQESFIENAMIMKQILDGDITDYIAATVLLSDLNYDNDESFFKSLTEAVKTGMNNAMMQISPTGEGKLLDSYTYFNKTKLNKCLENLFDILIGRALDKIKEEYNYTVDVEDTNGGSSSEGSAANPSKLKALKLKAPDSKYSDIYNYLCFRLEPHHDFHGVTLKNKSKGTITKSNQKDQYNFLKKNKIKTIQTNQEKKYKKKVKS
jgi:hypothetical protein